MSEEQELTRLVIVPPESDMQDMLLLMNTARSVYTRARSRQVRHLADQLFSRCYDWFTHHQISISYDLSGQRWRIDLHGKGGLIPYVVTGAIPIGPADLALNVEAEEREREV
jgi:hypothetical protein